MRVGSHSLLSLSALVALAASCRSSESEPTSHVVVRTSGDLELRVDPDAGTIDLARGGLTVFARATADVLVSTDAGDALLSFDSCTSRRLEGDVFVCETPTATLRWTLALTDHLESSLEIEARASMVVKRLATMVVDGEHGSGLFLGVHPRSHRILENGRFVAFDTTAQLEAGDVTRFGLASFAPIELRGHSVSNFSHLVSDLGTHALVAGYLTTERSIPTLGIGFEEPAPETSGRTPFTLYAAESTLVFHGKALKAGDRVSSERLYLDILPSEPLAAMERYAEALAAYQHVKKWPSETPVGWNSWSGGGGTGGHGQAIDEPLILDALAIARKELAPFGMTYFQVDDGWQTKTGDWLWDSAKFPSGGAAMAKKIAATGAKPGIWISPFQAEPASEIAKLHPEWLMPREEGVFGAIAKDRETLDLSNPEVIARVKQVVGGIAGDGFDRWLKADFTYYAVVGKPQKDPSLTNVEAFKAGWHAVREAIGPNAFLLGVGMVGLNVGVADGMRLTLDDGPKWDESDPDDVVNSPRALKATVRTGSRRWFYGNRAFVQHQDLIFFRSSPDASVPPLTLDESRAFATFVALDGGIVEIGDKLSEVATHPEWIDVLRRVMPVWPHGARPADVLLRDYPERFEQAIDAPLGKWTNIGLFNWGKNRDWSVNPPTAMADAPRTQTLSCTSECLAWEYWSESFVGRHTGDFTITISPHTAKVVALRASSGHPQLVGTNRHVTMGATDHGAESWDGAKKILSGSVATVPWEQRLFFWAPPGSTIDKVEIDGETPTFSQEGEIVKVVFTPGSPGKTPSYRLFFR